MEFAEGKRGKKEANGIKYQELKVIQKATKCRVLLLPCTYDIYHHVNICAIVLSKIHILATENPSSHGTNGREVRFIVQKEPFIQIWMVRLFLFRFYYARQTRKWDAPRISKCMICMTGNDSEEFSSSFICLLIQDLIEDRFMQFWAFQPIGFRSEWHFKTLNGNGGLGRKKLLENLTASIS